MRSCAKRSLRKANMKATRKLRAARASDIAVHSVRARPPEGGHTHPRYVCAASKLDTGIDA
jgi:hypothetical protein